MFKQLRKANQNDYLLITATLILLVVFNLSLLSYVQGQQKAAERDQAQALATGFSRTLKGEIKNALTLSMTLKELVLASYGKVDNFSTVAKYLLAENTAASNLQLAPKGKVTEIYPLKGNEAGKINLLIDPIRGPLCRYGISHQVTVTQGPIALKQGGKGLVMRTPIFIKKKGKKQFWGFAVVVMKIPQTFSSTAANLKSAGYSYELEKQVFPLNTSYKQVMQKGGLHEPITYSFTTADNSKWLLKLAPAKGWRYNKWNWFMGYIVIIDFAIAGLMIWVISGRISGRILERKATLDPLTQAYNRQGFDWKLASQGEKETTVIMLDIDDFKSINDVFGHQTGDAVLVQLTRNLQKCFGPKAIIGRNGGDEFVVALPGRMSDNRPAIKGLSVLKQEAASNGEAIPFSVSIGYSEFPGQAKDYEEALKFADAALYEVKIAGKNNFASYKSSLTEKKHHNQLGLGLRALAAGDPTPLLVMQMDTKEAIYVNKSLLELFGCELSSEFYDYYGQSLLNLISPGDRARVKEEFTDFVESAVDEERFRGDCQILTADARTLRVFCDMKYSVNQRYGALVYISFVLN
ncbi:diguanylate cyclase [Lactobacillus delbrueckii]|uniref:sensor domain-containing diguanylate cyclase n=1 Tax=Lactobacillus delbrueckii TaxID=1584 RepID=UPI0018DF392F|nr:diguanylate cyclase [Lactobacillus delbrueckii]